MVLSVRLRPVAVDTVLARGHELVTLRHPTTLELTKDDDMTRRGDCILAVGASKSAFELDPDLKSALRDGARLLMRIECGGLSETIQAKGLEGMTLSDNTSIVVRKSSYLDGRTVGILADKAARDIDRELASMLREKGNSVLIRLEAYVGQETL